MRQLAMGSAVLVCVAACVAAVGQQQAKPSAAIPATQPTSVSDLPSARPAVAAAPKTQGQSTVTWANGVLTVAGNGDALRNILGKIARETGLKVTGGVPDEQVFASYGPATLQAVVAELFDGMSVNMMLTEKAEGAKTLELTARTGGVTPASARPLTDEEQGGNAYRRDNFGPARAFGPQNSGNDRPVAQPPAAGQPGALPPVASPDMPVSTAVPTETTNAPETPAASGSTDSTGQQQSPNGVRTPEQIFEELRRRQQGAAPQ